MAVNYNEQPTKLCLEYYKMKSEYFFELTDIRESIIKFYKMPILHRFLKGYDFVQKQEIKKLEFLSKIELLDELILKEGGAKWIIS